MPQAFIQALAKLMVAAAMPSPAPPVSWMATLAVRPSAMLSLPLEDATGNAPAPSEMQKAPKRLATLSPSAAGSMTVPVAESCSSTGRSVLPTNLRSLGRAHIRVIEERMV